MLATSGDWELAIDTNRDDWRYQGRDHQDDDLLTDGEPDWLGDERRSGIPRDPVLQVAPLPREPALLLKVEDAARLLGVGRTTFFELISQGRIQTVRVGRRRLVVRSGLERFVEEISS